MVVFDVVMGVTFIVFICKNTTNLRASQLLCLAMGNEFEYVCMMDRVVIWKRYVMFICFC